MRTAVIIIVTSIVAVFATEVVKYETNDTNEIKTEQVEKTSEIKANLKDIHK